MLPVLALAGLALFFAVVIPVSTGKTSRWEVPALLSAAFFAYSLWPVLTIGPLGFWTEHVRNPWGVQIWFDLLCGIGIGWVLLAPRARAARVSPWPWLVLTTATGTIGLLAMFAFVLRAESAPGRTAPA